MQDYHLFEYAVVRLVPKVEREEFLNVGVILFCKSQKYLKVFTNLDHKRTSIFLDLEAIAAIKNNLDAFCRIAEGDIQAGPIALLEPAERFRWLTATRSTLIQSSKVHPGLCKKPSETHKKLFADLVL